MRTALFDYRLPPELIAQEPARPRDSSRLMVVDRATDALRHRKFFEIGEFLLPGDLLVVNESKVFKARLHGTVGAGPRARLGQPQGVAPTTVEIFLLRPDGDEWLALGKPGRKIDVGSLVRFPDDTTCRVTDKLPDGTMFVDFGKPAENIFAWTDRMGEVPTPPYVKQAVRDESDYQTVYAKQRGSVAAPTAGFHFTPELIEKLKTQDVRFAHITLHVGLGTFRPMKTEMVEDHVMHEEWIEVPEETQKAIEETKRNGGRVIAVGTTSVRALESGIGQGFTNLFITPGYRLKVVDALITNFHLPKSTLLVLVSSFAGRDLILKAYAEAVKERYRFYSFGDAMLII